MRHALISRATLAVAALALLVAPAEPATAQEWQVAREQFTFVGRRLAIHVDAPGAGTLRVIRGGPGAVRIASRAPRGFTAAGLADGRDLTLTAVGDGPVDYLVTVPEGVWVQVRVPGQPGRTLAGRADGGFRWDAAPPRPEPAPAWLPPLDDDVLFTTLARPTAPAVVRIDALENVASLSIRIEGDRFRVQASRPFSVAPGDDARMAIRPGPPALVLVLTLPADTRSFRLDAGPGTALVIDGETTAILCSPVTRQWLSNDRRILTFHPRGGSLRCEPDPLPRHEG